MVKSSKKEFLKIPKSLKWRKWYNKTPKLIHHFGRKLAGAFEEGRWKGAGRRVFIGKNQKLGEGEIDNYS